MPKPLDRQVAVVVGASSGIGRACALEFARRGAAVACAARSVHALDTLVTEIRALGGQAIAVPTDVTDPAAVTRLATVTEEAFTAIDTWVNGAGVSIYGRVEDITAAEYERVMKVNFLGQVHGVHAALPALRRAGGGVIIGISSVLGVRAVPLQAPYTASKWALRGFYDCLRLELAAEREPIAVTTILPASIDTPFFEHARSKTGALPKPPPPVYAPELVAAAVVHAAEHPGREVPVGDAAAAFLAGQRLAPVLTDAVLSVGRLGFAAQQNGMEDNHCDIVDAPSGGPGRVHGSLPGRVWRHSLLGGVLGQSARPAEMVSAVLSGLRSVRAPGRTHRSAESGAGPGAIPVRPDPSGSGTSGSGTSGSGTADFGASDFGASDFGGG